MTRKKVLLIAALALLALVFPLSLAGAGYQGALRAPDASAASYSIPWWTVDGGGGLSQGGVYTLRGTAGQPDPGIHTGGVYTVSGGFWSGSFWTSDFFVHNIYMPRLSR